MLAFVVLHVASSAPIYAHVRVADLCPTHAVRFFSDICSVAFWLALSFELSTGFLSSVV